MKSLYLMARIAGRPVGISGDQVESVVDIGAVTPVPGAQRSIRGLTALRSRVVTVIDSRAALECENAATSTRAVITQVEGHPYAVLVDSVEDVAPFAARPTLDGVALQGVWRNAAHGIIDRDGEPVLAIDLRAFIPGLSG